MKKRESGYMINVYLLHEDANGRTFSRTLAFAVTVELEDVRRKVKTCFPTIAEDGTLSNSWKPIYYITEYLKLSPLAAELTIRILVNQRLSFLIMLIKWKMEKKITTPSEELYNQISKSNWICNTCLQNKIAKHVLLNW